MQVERPLLVHDNPFPSSLIMTVINLYYLDSRKSITSPLFISIYQLLANLIAIIVTCVSDLAYRVGWPISMTRIMSAGFVKIKVGVRILSVNAGRIKHSTILPLSLPLYRIAARNQG